MNTIKMADRFAAKDVCEKDAAFISLLDADIKNREEAVRPLSQSLFARMSKLRARGDEVKQSRLQEG